MTLTLEELRKILIDQPVTYRMEVRNQEPVTLPGKIIEVRRQYGRVDVRVRLDPPASGKVWTSRENITLAPKENAERV